MDRHWYHLFKNQPDKLSIRQLCLCHSILEDLRCICHLYCHLQLLVAVGSFRTKSKIFVYITKEDDR